MKRWRRNVLKSCIRYLIETYGSDWRKPNLEKQINLELARDIEVVKECRKAIDGATWFDRPIGSTLFFWMWQNAYRQMARDGVPYWFRGRKPRNKKSQPTVTDDMARQRLREKIGKVRKRGYIAPGLVKSLIRCFAVPKVDDDIRMVYGGTSSAFNEWVWAPNFGMPTIESMLRSVCPTSWLGDVGIGEMFLNFPLLISTQSYCGVDLTTLFDDELTEDKKVIWERWTRCLMGAKPSPYQTIKAMLWAEDFVRGDRHSSGNPFRWSKIKLN